jgi:hypothetical protein
MALMAPTDDAAFTKWNAVFHSPVIAPYSELILIHGMLEGQQANHSLWLLDGGGKLRQIGRDVIAPVCLGVLPNDPIAIVADHGQESERYKLADLRTGEVALTLPTFGLRAKRALTDQLSKNMLLVAFDADGALGLYKFPVNAWYKATSEERENLVPRKVWSLASDPVDLVFSRDGSRVALLKGDDLQVLTLGEEVTFRTFMFPGTVVHPRDFHPSLNALLYESTAVMPQYGSTLGEVGVLDLGTGERRPAFYFAEETLPDKNPRFDAIGGHMFVNVFGNGIGRPEGTLMNGHSYFKARPVPAAFPIQIASSHVSVLLYDRLIQGDPAWTTRPVFVTRERDTSFLEVARTVGDVHGAFPFNIHSGMASGQSDKEMHATSRRNGQIDFTMNWVATAAYSPTTPASYVFADTAVIVGTLGREHDPYSWNSSTLERFTAALPPPYERRGDLTMRGGEIPMRWRERQGDIYLDMDVAVFNEPAEPYGCWVLHYPNWGHYRG